jgi:hypothetical protein
MGVEKHTDLRQLPLDIWPNDDFSPVLVSAEVTAMGISSPGPKNIGVRTSSGPLTEWLQNGVIGIGRMTGPARILSVVWMITFSPYR